MLGLAGTDGLEYLRIIVLDTLALVQDDIAEAVALPQLGIS